MRARIVLPAVIIIVSLSLLACGAGTLLAPTPIPTLVPTPSSIPPTPTAVATATPSVPTFSKETGMEVSNSEVTGQGEVSFEAGADATTLKITLNGTVSVTDQTTICWFCLETIHIAPGLKIPVEFLGLIEIDKTAKVSGGSLEQHLKLVEVNGLKTIKNPQEIESITFDKVVLDYPMPTNGATTIIAGDQGATLRKVGKLVFLVDGEAHLSR
jgi:hypothetical protein